MKQTLPLLLLALLFCGCMQQLTTRNIILVEHLEKLALQQSLDACKAQDDCEQTRLIAGDMATRSVLKAINRWSVGCDEPPCDWPDTIAMAFSAKSTSLRYFRCDEPPCDWPDTIHRAYDKYLMIGYPIDGQYYYEFSIVDQENKPIAKAVRPVLQSKRQLKPGQLGRVTFTVVNPNYSGDAQIVMKRTSSKPGDQPEVTYRINTRIYNLNKVNDP